MSDNDPKMPAAQLIYGEFVYWVTILAAIICMVGPVVAMMDVENNLLNPHYLFAHIFDGEKPASVWALSATEPPILEITTTGADGTTTRELEPAPAVELLKSLPRPPAGSPPDSVVLHAGTSLRLARAPEGAEHEFYVFEDGEQIVPEDHGYGQARAREELLAVYGYEVFTDGHFWAEHPTSGDGFTQIGLALGCSVALWGLILAAGAFLKDKVYLYVALSLWVGTLVLLSAAGLVKGH